MISDWAEGFQDGYSFCKMLSEAKEYKGKFFPDRNGSYRNGFAEGTIVGKRKFNVSWKFVDDGKGTFSFIEKS